MATLWIGQDYLVKRSVIDSNVEYDKITPVINLVQRKYIKRLLGTDLYNALDVYLIDFIDNAVAIPAPYKLLLDDYILEMIVYYTLFESSPTFKFRYTNKGLMVKDSENAQPATNADLEFVMAIWKQNAEMIAEELIQYLQYNYSTYPEYGTNLTNGIIPQLNAYDTDVYLGDKYYNYRNDAGDFRKG